MIIALLIIIALWILFNFWIRIDPQYKGEQEPVKSNRQIRIEKHRWDKDEYWFIGAVLLLIAIKLFWR